MKSTVRRAPLRGLTAEKKVGSPGRSKSHQWLDAVAQIAKFVVKNLFVALIDLTQRRDYLRLQGDPSVALDQGRTKRMLVGGNIDEHLPVSGVAGGVDNGGELLEKNLLGLNVGPNQGRESMIGCGAFVEPGLQKMWIIEVVRILHMVGDLCRKWA